MAATRIVSENEIVSLVNSPSLLSVTPSIDEAGRPRLLLELEFPNDCYAQAGADLALLQGEGGEPAPVLILLQTVPAEGCPDIFIPERSSLLALLPPALAGQDIAIVGRPGGPEGVRTVRLEGQAGSAAGAAIREPTPETVLPRLDGASASPAPVGYTLNGTVRLSEDCADRLRVRVFEVPDAQGNPTSDAVLLSAPAACLASEETVELSVGIETPQRLQGRRVVPLNAVPPSALVL